MAVIPHSPLLISETFDEFQFLQENTSNCWLRKYSKFRVVTASGSELIQEKQKGAVSDPHGGGSIECQRLRLVTSTGP